MIYKEKKIKPKKAGLFKKYIDFVFEKSCLCCSLEKHSWFCRERKLILFPILAFLKIYYFFKNIFVLTRLAYYEMLYFAHLRLRFIHDKLYQKNVPYKKVNDFKYTRPIRRASILGFVLSFVIFQLLGTAWPEFFNPTHPKVAEGANSFKAWTTETDFSTGTIKTNIITEGDNDAGDVNDNDVVKLATTSEFGDGVDGALPTSSSLNTTFYLDTQTNGYNGRTSADGITTTTTGQVLTGATSVPVTSSTGFAAGDDVLIAKLWKTGDTTIINPEMRTISSVVGNTLTISSGVTGNYTMTGVLVQRVPNYTDVNIGASGNLTTHTWDGTKGGMVVFKANGTLTIASGGKIDTSNLGYGIVNPSGHDTPGGPGVGTSGWSGCGDMSGDGGSGYGGAGGVGDGYDDECDGWIDGGLGGPAYSSFPDLGSSSLNDHTGWLKLAKGGGMVYFYASTISNSGAILAKGQTNTAEGSPGASGGSIYILTNSTALGTVSADGGATADGKHGGGGGGRIKTVTTGAPTGTITAAGGEGYGDASGDGVAGSIINSTPTFQPSGTITGLELDTGAGNAADWSNLSWRTLALPANTTVEFRARTSSDGGNWSSWTAYFVQDTDNSTTGSADLASLSPSRFIELELKLTSSGDNTNTPTVKDFTVTDSISDPVNENITMYRQDGSTPLKNTNGDNVPAGSGGGWTNQTSIKLEATGLSCSGCVGSTGRKIQVESKVANTSFDGTGLVEGDSTDNGDGTFTSTATVTGDVGSAYHMRVRTIDSEGRVSGWTAYAVDATAFGIEQTVPTWNGSAPSTGGAQTTDNTPTWDWADSSDTGGSGIYNYVVTWDDNNDFSSPEGTSTTSTSAYTHTVALSDGTWYFRATSYDNAGNSTNSTDGSVTVDTQGPTNVSGLTGYTDNTKGIQITSNSWTTETDPYLEWTASTDTGTGLDHYKYYFGTDSNGTPVTNNGNVTNYSIASQTAGTYYFKVVAVDVAGNESETVTTFIFKTDNVNPNPPTGLTLTDRQSTSLTVSWTAPVTQPTSGIKKYVVERKLLAQEWASAVALEPSPLTATTLTDTGLTAGTRYVYRVKTVGGSDLVSSWAPSESGEIFYTVDSDAPSIPVITSVDACDGTASNCSGSSQEDYDARKGYELKLTWTASTDSASGLEHYKIYRREGSDSVNLEEYTLVGIITNPLQVVYHDNDSNNQATWADYGKASASPALNDYTTYHYRIVAYDVAGNDTDFDPNDPELDMLNDRNHGSETTVDVTAPSVPTNLSGDPMAYNQIDLSWGASTDKSLRNPEADGSGVAGYKIYRKRTNPTPEADFADITANICTEPCNDNTVTDSYNFGANGAETYEYKIYAYDVAGNPTDPTNYFATSEPIITPNNSQPTAPGTVTVTTATGDPNLNTTINDDNGITESETSVTVDSTDGFSASGSFKIDNEVIIYSSKTSTSFNGLTRGGNQTTATSHLNNAVVRQHYIGHQNTITYVGSSLPTGEEGNEYRVGSYKIYRSTTVNGTYSEIAGIKLGGTLSYNESATTYTYVDNDTSNNDIADNQSKSYLTRTGDGGSTSYAVTKAATTTLSNATSYYYKVRAFSNDAIEIGSTMASPNTAAPHTGWDTTADDTAPDAPTNVEVKNLNPGEDYVRNIITWSRISAPSRNGTNDFLEYRIYRRAEDEVSFSQLTVDGNNMLYRADKSQGMDTNYYVDAIHESNAGKNYYYYIVSVDDAATVYKYADNTIINAYNNVSAESSTVSINPGTVNPTVSGVTVASTGVSSAVINWTTDQNSDSLVEYRVKDSNDVVASGKDRTQPTTNHSVTLGNLAKGTQYQYRVISRNSLGNIDEDDATTWRDFTTLNFTISNPAGTTTTTTAAITWNTNTASDSYVEYKLERAAGEAEEKSLVAGDSALTTSHEVSIKSLKPNRTYTYKIRSVTADKFIAETDFMTFRTRADDLDKFSILPADASVSEKNITATTAQITWVTTNATTSWVEYGTDSGIYTMSAGDNDFNTLHVVKLANLVPGTKYYYRVKGKDENGVEVFSPENTLTAILMPEITNLRVREFGPYSATITFDTNVEALVSLNYGKDEGYGAAVTIAKAARNHVITLEDLDDNSTYYFQASATDQFKNNVKSAGSSFATPLDTQGPEVSELKVDVLPVSESSESASVIISWTTDKPSTTQVQYDDKGSGEKYEEQTTEDVSLNTSHTVMIKDLNTSANYRFRIVAKDKRGNLTKTKSATFITPTKEKSLIQIIIKSLEDTFSWTKNVPTFFGKVGNRIIGK